MRYDVVDLRLLVAVADSRSITAGAAACKLSPSSASVRLRGLEEVAGTALFERHARGVRTTAGGAIMVEHVRSCLEVLDRMHNDLSQYSAGFRSQLRITVDCSSLSSYLLEDMQRYLSSHPRLRIRLDEQPTEQALDAVASRRAHLGIIAHLASPQSVLAFSRYGHDRLVVASSATSDAISRDGIGFRDCLEMPIITLAPAAALTRLLTHHAESLGRQLDVRTNVQTFSEILHLVSAGVGVAILPLPIAARASLSSVRLTELLEPWARRTLRICTPRDQSRFNQLALQFLSLVVTPSDLLAGWRHSSGRDSVEANSSKVESQISPSPSTPNGLPHDEHETRSSTDQD